MSEKKNARRSVKRNKSNEGAAAPEFHPQEELIREEMRLRSEYPEDRQEPEPGTACTNVLMDFFTGECENQTADGSFPALIMSADANSKPLLPWWTVVGPEIDGENHRVRVFEAGPAKEVVTLDLGETVRFFRPNVGEIVSRRLRAAAQEYTPTVGQIRTMADLLKVTRREAAKEMQTARSSHLHAYAVRLKKHLEEHFESYIISAIRQAELEADAVARGELPLARQPSLAEVRCTTIERLESEMATHLASLPKNAKGSQVLDQPGLLMRKIDQALRVRGEDANLEDVAEHLNSEPRSLQRRLQEQNLRMRTIKKRRSGPR